MMSTCWMLSVLKPIAFTLLTGGMWIIEGFIKFIFVELFFVTRAKDNMNYKRINSYQKDVSHGVVYDQSILLNNHYASKDYPIKMRRIKFKDEQTGKVLIFLTNNFHLTATQIAQLYKHRWKIELFFKWIKQHLKIKSFWGQSENAVK